MKQRQTGFQGILAGIGLLILIFDSSLAVQGAGEGIRLCIQTVIPALFPFFVLSTVLTESLAQSCSGPIQILTNRFGIPEQAGPVLIPAFLGGYPVGAKCAGDLYRRGQIEKSEAERLLAFCSNAGPSFLFGMVSGFFSDRKTVWVLWGIHVLSALLTAWFMGGCRNAEGKPVSGVPRQEVSAIISAARAMILVCCWVVLFRIVIAFLEAWFLLGFPQWLQVFLTGILELTNGCCGLDSIPDENLRFVLCACMLSFGGFCVLLQTASVTKGLSLKCYLTGKLLQTAFSFALSCAFLSKYGILLTVFLPVVIWILKKTKKPYGNPDRVPV